MVAKLFVLGTPGSGKTTISRHIVKYVQSQGIHAVNLSDYSILLDMCERDIKHEYFKPSKYGGFYLTEQCIYDRALEILERRVQEVYEKNHDLVIIEFARSNFLNALKVFEDDFLYQSSILLLKVDILTCMERVRKRVICPKTPDDHYTPRKIFQLYIHKDDEQYLNNLRTQIEQSCDIASENIVIIDNKTTEEKTLSLVERYLDSFIESCGLLQREALPLLAQLVV